MKIMIFTEGTLFTHSNWLALQREETVRRVKDGERPEYRGTIPIGNAAAMVQSWSKSGAEIIYLTSCREPDEIEQVQEVLHRHDFPPGRLFFRQNDEEYKDVAERTMPDIIVEDDCESIGGEVEMTYPRIRPEIKTRIISIVVKEFGGIDHLPQNPSELLSYGTSYPSMSKEIINQ